MNRSKKRARKYSTTLKKYNTTDIKQDELYYLNSKGGFSAKDKLKVKIDGISFEMYLKLYKGLQEDMSILKTYLNNSNIALTEFLIRSGYNTPNVKQSALIEDLEELLVIVDEKPYDLLQVDGNGYIIKKEQVNGHIIDRQEYPDDLLFGYYKLVDGDLVVDEEMKSMLGQVVL